MSSNAWLNGLAKLTYPIGEKMHGLYLHFKSPSYSYPKYSGKTGYNLEVHLSNHRKDFMVINALLNKIGDRNLEKFLVINRIGGISELNQLNSIEALDNYDCINNSLTNKDVFNENVENFLLSRFGEFFDSESASTPTDDYVGSYCPFLLDRIAEYRRGDYSLVRVQNALSACYLLSRFPVLETKISEENVIQWSLLQEIKKVKEFTDWWCLT